MDKKKTLQMFLSLLDGTEASGSEHDNNVRLLQIVVSFLTVVPLFEYI